METSLPGPWNPRESAREAGLPLSGIRVLDLTQMGPGPWATSFLAAWGADVITVARPQEVEVHLSSAHYDAGKRRIELNLKSPQGVDLARRLASGADVLLEGFRPGVMERLGLGPEELRSDHDRLIYVRLTGYGQEGPYAQRAGHDINYLAVSGALSAIGRGEPAPPMAMLGDFAGGALHAVIGVLLALRTRECTGIGDVVDAAIADGVSQLFYSTAIQGSGGSRVKLLDGTAPFYTAYPCSDGRRISVGALESRFFVRLLELLEIDEPDFIARQYDEELWPRMREAFAERFGRKSRDKWVSILADQDTCVAPVLEPNELSDDPHNAARMTYVRNGGLEVARAPRLAGVPRGVWHVQPTGSATRSVLLELGLNSAEIESLADVGVVGPPASPLNTV